MQARKPIWGEVAFHQVQGRVKAFGSSRPIDDLDTAAYESMDLWAYEHPIARELRDVQ